MMTIQEKAKAYDEAVKRAKSQIAAGLVNQDVCEYILPGLVEMEDENIAESLIKTLKDRMSLGVVSNGYSREDYIEWLEKYLKTNSEKPKKWLKEDYDYYDTIVRKLEVIGEDSGLTRNQIQFLIEHNPCDFEVEIEKAYKNADEVQYRKGFKDGVASVKLPEWTEEDETMVEDIIEAIPTNYATSDYNEMVSWLRFKLKSLKPQPGLSKEDFIKFGNLEYERGKKDGSIICWKPTDEQMEQLHQYTPDNRFLTELYEDLKKIESL